MIVLVQGLSSAKPHALSLTTLINVANLMDASDNLFQPIALIILMTKSIELSDQMGIVVYLEARIDTNLELLVHGRVPEGKSHHRNAGR